MNWLFPELNFLAPLISWAGLGSSITGLAILAAVFLPGVRRLAIEAAIVVGVATFVYWAGDQTGSKRVKAQWDAAVEKSVEKSNEARSGAVDDVKRAGPGRLRNDRYDRDNR